MPCAHGARTTAPFAASTNVTMPARANLATAAIPPSATEPVARTAPTTTFPDVFTTALAVSPATPTAAPARFRGAVTNFVARQPLLHPSASAASAGPNARARGAAKILILFLPRKSPRKIPADALRKFLKSMNDGTGNLPVFHNRHAV
jgi:hypothetical protein